MRRMRASGAAPKQWGDARGRNLAGVEPGVRSPLSRASDSESAGPKPGHEP
jgi:hypothetical protein